MASNEVNDITINNHVDCIIEMLIAVASQQSIKKGVQLTTAGNTLSWQKEWIQVTLYF